MLAGQAEFHRPAERAAVIQGGTLQRRGHGEAARLGALGLEGQEVGHHGGAGTVAATHAGAGRHQPVKHPATAEEFVAHCIELVVPAQDAIEVEPGAEDVREAHSRLGQRPFHEVENGPCLAPA